MPLGITGMCHSERNEYEVKNLNQLFLLSVVN